jgi:predicted metal-dependent hydrolase
MNLLPMTKSTREIKLGAETLPYELIFSKRKSIGITVYPDGRVIVRAPSNTPMPRIEEVIQERSAWILKHRKRFAVRPPTQPHQYVSGEIFRYLGREYCLQIERAERERVILGGENLIVQTPTPTDPRQIAKLIHRWYTRQAQRVFAERLEACFAHVKSWNVAYPQLSIRRMKTRWGSCTSKGKVTLNLKLIQAHVELIDYVICHELCHLREMNHSKRYYALLDSIFPSWKAHKKRLNEYGFTD